MSVRQRRGAPRLRTKLSCLQQDCHTLSLLLFYASKPSAHILALPHPNLLSVTLTWLQMEKSKGWAACTFGSRLILVSWLYLFSLLLPLYSLTTRAAWLVILNRTPDLSTKVSSFNTSLGNLRSGGKRSEKEEVPAGRRESRGQDIAPGCTGHSPNHSLTGHHWTYEGETGSADGLALLSPRTPSPGTKTRPGGGEGEELFLSFTHQLLLFLPTHTDPGAYTSGC